MSEEPTGEDNNTGVIVGAVVGLIFVAMVITTGVVIGIVLWKKNKYKLDFLCEYKKVCMHSESA